MMKKFVSIVALIVIGTFCAEFSSTLAAAARPKRARKRLIVKVHNTPAATPSQVVITDEQTEGAAPVVILTTKYLTAVVLPSKPKQLVCKLIDSGDISEQKGKDGQPENVVYLTAERAGKRSNVFIETHDGPIEFRITTKEQESYTRQVIVKIKRRENQIENLNRQLQAEQDRAQNYKEKLSQAENAARLAAESARRALDEGRIEGASQGRKEALAALTVLLEKGAKVKSHVAANTKQFRVKMMGTPVRSGTGWYALYQMQNKTKFAIRLEVKKGEAKTLSVPDEVLTIAARGSRRLAFFVETLESIPPAVTFKASDSGQVFAARANGEGPGR